MKGCLSRIVKWTIGIAVILLIISALFSPSKPKQVAEILTNTPVVLIATATSVPATNTAVAAPLPTNTPPPPAPPTNTPLPTNTLPPTAIPTATNTPDPVTALRSAIVAVLGDSNRGAERVAKVEIAALGVINVQWAIDDNFSADWVKSGARSDAVEILKAIHASGLQRDLINLVGTFSMVDQFGKKTEDPVVWLTFSVDTVNQINWADNAFIFSGLPKTIYEIADHSKIHDEFSD